MWLGKGAMALDAELAAIVIKTTFLETPISEKGKRNCFRCEGPAGGQPDFLQAPGTARPSGISLGAAQRRR